MQKKQAQKWLNRLKKRRKEVEVAMITAVDMPTLLRRTLDQQKLTRAIGSLEKITQPGPKRYHLGFLDQKPNSTFVASYVDDMKNLRDCGPTIEKRVDREDYINRALSEYESSRPLIDGIRS